MHIKLALQFLWLFGISILTCSASTAQDLPPATREIQKSIVFIQAEAQNEMGALRDSSATGFFIDWDGNIITSHHLITQLILQLGEGFREDTLRIRVHPGRKDAPPVEAELIDASAMRDLLLLKIRMPPSSAPACVDFLGRSGDLTGRQVFSVGFPSNLDSTLTSAGNILSSDGPGATLISNLEINAGQSGSPVFLENGTVVGIAKGQMADSRNSPVVGQYILIPAEDANRIIPGSSLDSGCDAGVRPLVATESLATGSTDSIDILAVVDDSGSMKDDQSKFAEGLTDLAEQLAGSDIDFRLCITTTDFSYYGGDVIPWRAETDGIALEFVDRNTENLSTLIRYTIDSLGAEWSSDEQPIRSVINFLRHFSDDGCLRQQGAFVVVLLSDEDERSVGGRQLASTLQFKPLETDNLPRTLRDTFSQMFPDKSLRWHSIIVAPDDPACEEEQDQQSSPAFPGALSAELSTSTGGFVMSICSPDFRPLFGSIYTDLVALVRADLPIVPLDPSFPISAPADGGGFAPVIVSPEPVVVVAPESPYASLSDQNFTIIYYKRASDEGRVEEALNDLGLVYSVRAGLNSDPTDTLTCTPEVSVEQIAEIVQLLSNTGVAIEAIRGSTASVGSGAQLKIESTLGAIEGITGGIQNVRPAFSSEDIYSLGSCPPPGVAVLAAHM